MLPILPTQEYYTDAFFTTLDVMEKSELSLVVAGPTDGTDIMLSGM